MPADNRFLIRRRLGWYATVEVPPSLRDKLGRRIRRTLKTQDLHVARARRWRAVADIKAQIEAARRGVQGDPLTHEALAYREALSAETERTDKLASRIDWDDPEDVAVFEANRTDDILRDDIRDRAEAIGREQGRAVGGTFFGIATGKFTPLTAYVEDWLRDDGAKGPLKERTKIEHRKAVRELSEWLAQAQLPPVAETITRRIAGRFVTEHLIPSGRHRRTIAKTVSTLSTLWKWLQRRGHLADEEARNPWTGQATATRAVPMGHPDAERAFTDVELARLLASPSDDTLADFMRVAALTGMRREEIGRLTVADCASGIFIVQRGKTAAARRRVPIHSHLASLVERRSASRKPDAYLFDELKSGTAERTDPIGKRFTTYRRALGVQDGTARRSLVNFHSFRRWFTTAAINAGQPPHIVSLLLGHSEGRKGMTLGTYWAGAEDDALRACVEAVRLPLTSAAV